jgi:hypothetical protein
MAMLAITPFLLLGTNAFSINVGLGICWLYGVLGTLAGLPMALSDIADMQAIRAGLAKRPPWVRWSLTAIDVPVLIVLAGLGYWWTFALFATQAFLSTVTDSKAATEAESARTTSAGGTS